MIVIINSILSSEQKINQFNLELNELISQIDMSKVSKFSFYSQLNELDTLINHLD